MEISRPLTLSAFICLSLQTLTAATPNPASDQELQSHIQTLPVSYETAFPKAIETLIANGCIILAADRQIGFITFRTQSEDNTVRGRRHVNVLEGTVLFKPDSSTSTRVQAKLTLSWQEHERSSYETGAKNDADLPYYKWLFELLSKPFASPLK